MERNNSIQFESILLYRHECFTGKYTTRKIHKNYIRDPSGLFSIISHVSLSIRSMTSGFNDLKRIQQKLARHEHHLENYSFFIRKRLVPHGLLPKTRPAFDSHNPQFHQSWKQNQQYFGRHQLKLLSQVKNARSKLKTFEETRSSSRINYDLSAMIQPLTTPLRINSLITFLILPAS